MRYVFIITYGRSGSTLVQSILNDIPGWRISGENYNTLYYIYKSVRSANRSHEDYGKQQTNATNPWYGAEHIDADTFTTDLVESFKRNILNPSEDTRVLGFKEIRHFGIDMDDLGGYLNFLRACFAPAKFVFNMREPGAVAKSGFKAGWWKGQDPAKIESNIARYNDMMLALAASSDCCLISYDQYTRSSDALRPLFDFLGEQFEERAVEKALSNRLVH
ncbi:sulfotransferase [Hyphomicrobiaceae bacterium 22]|uniref:Sulfotransferase n=2 Tax=Prosthecodimorpha staleyi TaxID=2840188 RepID=A0A947D8N1_9HYPH|nr:sulfotransferase [Prosthecodimorpha staleyi]